ncbi:MAG: nitrous oxide reductase accessory protein NosL [Magnetococcus sp. DMHC-6]
MIFVTRRLLVVLVLTFSFFGCRANNDDQSILPKEPTPETMGYYCGMNLKEHSGPKGQIIVAGEENTLWFSTIQEAFSYSYLEGATRHILAFYVNDMGQSIDWDHPQPGSWIKAESAYYVLGSKRGQTTGDVEIVPFGSKPQAENFMHSYGGRVFSFNEINEKDILPNQPKNK